MTVKLIVYHDKQSKHRLHTLCLLEPQEHHMYFVTWDKSVDCWLLARMSCLVNSNGFAADCEVCFGHKLVLQVHLVEIDIEQDPKIAEAAGVQSTPTVQMFKDKERIQHLPGVKMKSDYRKFINEGLGEKVKVPA